MKEQPLDTPVVGDIVMLRTESQSVQARTSVHGYRGFLRPVRSSIVSNSFTTTKRWVGPKDPDQIGLIIDHIDAVGTVRGKRVLVFWHGELLEGRVDDFIVLSERTYK